MRQLSEYESKLGYGAVAEGLLTHPEAAGGLLPPSPKAKRPCLALPLNPLLHQAVTPTASRNNEAAVGTFVFEASPGPSGLVTAAGPGGSSRTGSPSTPFPGCHSPLVCHSPLLSPS